MELLACIRALRWIRSNSPWPGVSRVQIMTDSLYVTDNIGRSRNWRKNDWRNQYDEPRENWTLWKEFLSGVSESRDGGAFRMVGRKENPYSEANRQSR